MINLEKFLSLGSDEAMRYCTSPTCRLLERNFQVVFERGKFDPKTGLVQTSWFGRKPTIALLMMAKVDVSQWIPEGRPSDFVIPVLLKNPFSSAIDIVGFKNAVFSTDGIVFAGRIFEDAVFADRPVRSEFQQTFSAKLSYYQENTDVAKIRRLNSRGRLIAPIAIN